MKKIFLFAFAVLVIQIVPAAGLNGKGRDKEIKVITYNIHHGNPPAEKGKIDLDAIAEVISNSKADFALLQEVENGTTRSFGINQAKELSQKSGLRYYLFFKAIDFAGGDYGIAIISRFPADSSKSIHLYAQEGGEQRVMGLIYTSIPGFGKLCIATTHFDLPNKIRTVQVTQADSILKAESMPVIFGGDLNAQPDSPEMKILFDNYLTSGLPHKFTFPNKNPDRTIDYLFTGKKSGFKIKDYRVIENIDSSDHLPLTMTLLYSF
jgi:endonuclease/exonuclease/phosphatase family metal-dependent hydrolase